MIIHVIGASDPVKFGELAAQLEKCNTKPKVEVNVFVLYEFIMNFCFLYFK